MRRFFFRSVDALAVASIIAITACNTSASAATVKILSSTKAATVTGTAGDDDLNDFYNGVGITSSIFSGAVTSSQLTGVDLLVVMLPDDAFVASEISAMSSFLSGGGRVLFMGEHSPFAPTENFHINTALGNLSSNVEIKGGSFDIGFNNALKPTQVSSHFLNNGVNTINYGNTSSVGVVGSATTEAVLFTVSDQITIWGIYETFGLGSIVLLGDTNMLSNLEQTGLNDNHQWFENVATQGFSPVPVPTAAWLFGSAIGLLGWLRRKAA